MNERSDILNSEKTLHLLRELESNPHITQRDLSQRFGISLGKVNFLIRALLDKGIIKANNFKNSKNKISYLYVLTSEGIKLRFELTHKFFTKKSEEYEQLKREIEALTLRKGEFL